MSLIPPSYLHAHPNLPDSESNNYKNGYYLFSMYYVPGIKGFLLLLTLTTPQQGSCIIPIFQIKMLRLDCIGKQSLVHITQLVRTGVKFSQPLSVPHTDFCRGA